ncbi:15-hydroxyprostaglandin dehydrogenase [Colletotrichum godetiae]|uniref:15-hydroxyprostaglandin dehydrogenase n=1 Tax=Colletotrichum godetiae TaxID=1209918 RepID=A0AAJ0A7D8_9PEZI|nr:15-hydroxyprostaglandin dehydrogenase [Colletotrichum godetiae]KAK1657894.1 15-hydroxyprostaglandin dehydrogenase [Colletotrichum godetiae]
MTSGSVAIITGACSGIGEAFTLDLVSKGWRIAMFDIKPNADLVTKLEDAVTFYQVDVADYESQAKCFQETWDKFGRLDLVCTNAGIFDQSSLYILNHRHSDTIPPKPNLKCRYQCGTIVATASAASLYPHRGFPEYSGSKAAVWQFVRASAQILRMKENIRINCIRPGSIATPLMPAAMAAAAGSSITPMSTVISAMNRIITDESLSGEALECSVDKVLLTPDPEPLNGETSTRACFVWDPIFHQIHHEPSGLPDAADPVQTK